MGCFNTVCGATGTEIHNDDLVYYGFITLDPYGSSNKTGGVYPYDLYSFLTPLMVGTYNDYGFIKEIDSNKIHGNDNNDFSKFVLERFFKNCFLAGESILSESENINEKFQQICFSRKDAEKTGFKTTFINTEKYENFHIWMANKELVDYLISKLEINKWINDERYREYYELFTGLKEVDKRDIGLSRLNEFGRYMNLNPYSFTELYGVNSWAASEEKEIRRSFIPQYSESIKTLYEIIELMWHSKRFVTPQHVYGSQELPWEADGKYHSLVASFMDDKIKNYEEDW